MQSVGIHPNSLAAVEVNIPQREDFPKNPSSEIAVPSVRRGILLHFLDKKTEEERPFVTYGNMITVLEMNWWFWQLRLERGLFTSSLKSYAYVICDFYRYCEAVTVSPLSATYPYLIGYFDDMERTRGVMPNTINWRAYVVEQFYTFLKAKRLITSLPFTTIIKRSVRHTRRGTLVANNQSSNLRRRANQTKRKFVRRDQVAEFIHTLPQYRNRVIANTLWATGLRINELVNLTTDPPHLPVDRENYFRQGKSFDMEVTGKGGKTRLVELPSDILKEIDTYIRLYRPPMSTDSKIESYGFRFLLG